MRNTIIATSLIMVNAFSIGCSPDPSIRSKGEMYYQKYKKNFAEKFIDHFPKKSTQAGIAADAFSSMEQKKNNFSLMLYQYNVRAEDIRKVNHSYRKHAIAEYQSSDSCLLIVNRFETIETDGNQKMPMIDNSSLNKECYSNKYPIPNFINYEKYNKDRDLRLDDTFVIYVLESKKVNSWREEFGMMPNAQMPENWKNGYSKGIAISQKNQTIIYWAVIW